MCSDCGYETAKWLGRCPVCNMFNTIVEMKIKPDSKSRGISIIETSDVEPILLNDIELKQDKERITTNIIELDRVLGGGIVQGGLLLLGGDPGIGKSTLLLQICRALYNLRILYISGEESITQIKMRADRLNVKSNTCYLLAETDMYNIESAIENIKPRLLLIDSIQTMRLGELNSLPGSVTQVRECAAFFANIAKKMNIAVLLVGHVTKDGNIAGPRVLEHMVDTVLYFEGEGKEAYRLIRSVKNRFGSTNEVGLFEMSDKGLTSIENPSAYMLSGRPKGVSGSVVTCPIEGSRPLLVEVQALAAFTNFATPRRTATGIDYNRMVMLMAVLEKRAGLKLATYDAYVNIAGGFRIDEPAADAGIIAAIASCYKNKPIDPQLIVLGEVGLAGEMRAISQVERRIIEAQRQGFTICIIPQSNKDRLKTEFYIRVLGAANIGELLSAVL